MSVENVDELINMGNCPMCGNTWYMTPGEQSFFKSLIDKKAAEGAKFSMPKKCKDCREKKAEARISPEKVIAKVDYMIHRTDNQEYVFGENELKADLKDVLRMLKILFPTRKENNEKKESLGQSTQS